MQTPTLLTVLVILVLAGYWIGRQRSVSLAQPAGGIRFLHSLPNYYGLMAVVWAGVPAVVVLLLWGAFDSVLVNSMVMAGLPEQYQQLSADRQGLIFNQIGNIARGADPSTDAALLAAAEHYKSLMQISVVARTIAIISLVFAGIGIAYLYIKPEVRAREHFEAVLRIVLLACSLIAIFTTLGIVLSVLWESIKFFRMIPATEFLFGLQWSPQIALRADQQGASGAFGAIPLFAGTMLIASIALIVAVPIGLMSAIYLAEYASSRVRNTVKPLLEILAGIPTVVYGFFAALTAAPFIRDIAHWIGDVTGWEIFANASAQSALAAGGVMGIMIIPFISSLADDVITAVPRSLRDGSLAIGATRSETVRKVILPAALPGVVGSIILAASRAIGETMIVVMAAGLSAKLTANPLDSVTTVTVQIVTLLVGDQEFDSPKTLAAFALGLALFVVTLALNFIALKVVNKYREQYD